MPLLGTFGAASAKGLGLTSGGGVPFDVKYLVVAGGGSGGLQAAGGAGAGGYRLNTGETSGGSSSSEAALELVTGEEYSVVIGAGGVSAPPAPTYPVTTPPTPATDSTLATITSTGGGTGGGYSPPADPDVHGQGGSGAANSPGTLYPGITGQGSAGGNFVHSGPGYAGGGGGGAGGAGGNGGANGGNGGVGLESDITGSNVFRAGGGGGGGEGYSQAGHGGGGSGGSGFVAIKVPDSITATFSAGVTSSLNSGVSGYRIYSVTATSSGSETVTFEKG